jgi:molecular chaperone HtpG
MTTQHEKEQFTFEAEIGQLLHLLSHSLYQNREIAIRELVSNASDALDKYRYQILTRSGAATTDDLRITIEPRKDDRQLVIRDNGIGMTHDELVANLGTIARSGSKEFIRKAAESESSDDALSLIGQFGVGFYSAFMLADRVEVRTRSAADDHGWVWESTGDGSYAVTEADEVPERGTEIRLHLKDGLDEFTDAVRLKFILKKYSAFVPHPIYLEDEHINDQKPIWLEPKSSLTEEQYHGFYEHITHFPGQKPLWYLHLAADSPFQFHSILFCPESNLEKMGFGRNDHGLHLCARRILVQNDNRDLLPDYLRFLRGIVDSADLPLNVSREALQDNTVFRKMQKVITRKVLDHLNAMADDDAENYLKFYREFGSILREGISSDYDNRDRLAKLLRFQSTKTSSEQLASLSDYESRMAEGQEQIYFVTGTDLQAIQRDPNLEIFRDRELEVLILSDPVDEFVLSNLGTFNDHQIVAVDSADLKLPERKAEDSAEDAEEKSERDQPAPTGFEQVLSLFRTALEGQVKDVRQSQRLTDSACCLVNAQGSMSTTMQRVLRMNSPEFEMGQMILEINPNAPLVKRLCELSVNSDNDGFIQNCGRQLHANALVLAGLAPDGDDMTRRVQEFMMELAAGRSSISLS